ncbi:hypothetical protein L3Y34_009687 [Caenorhabditis briggsae]|uniref:C2H2-type domain-containing protein n=1 Tax=Caenorhabditis briggsae TaxID=6238 RepID=A0AAE9A695_CAEBR|nr:hypothetical protein L3Y34_009687 [Caenorhabditis briggsae]
MEQHLSNFEDDLQDLSWTPEDDECHKIQMYPDVVHLPGKPNMIQFAHGELVELDKAKEAVAYFGSKTGLNNNGSKVRPSLEQVHTKFRFIRNRHHMDKLREYETLGSTKANRKSNLEFISMELEKENSKMNNMFVVAKPPSGDAFNKLMAFLEENRMEFSVRCSEPNKVLAVPTSSRASEIIDFPTAKKIRKESKLDFQKITFNQSEISDNLADNELRIPKEESKVSPIAQINNEQHVDYNGWSPGEDFRALMATWDMDKLKCEVCKRKMVCTNGFQRTQHALSHLKLKTWKCTVCNKLLSQPGSGRDHFKFVHRDVPYTRLVQTISEEEKIQIDEMQIKCFPSKPIHQTRHQNDH